MTALFGTDGIRGRANRYPMDPQTVFHVAAAAAVTLQRRFARKRVRKAVIVGRDTRRSGAMLQAAASAGLASCGLDVLDGSVLPTPAVSHLVRSEKLLAGLVVSASHNPYEDNGIKFFGPGGCKLDEAVEREVEETMELSMDDIQAPYCGKKVGVLVDFPQGTEIYRDWITRAVAPLDLEGLKVVVDCANGAASSLAPDVLRMLGAETIAIHTGANGLNINRGCGSLHPRVVKKAVLKEKATLGISLDGDADRALFVDETGGFVDGDHVLALCAGYLWKRKGGLPSRKVVSTVMANLGLELALKKQGLELVRSAVGDRWVKECMDREKAVLGGEQSGHIIFSEYSPTGDGLLTALKVLSVVKGTGKRLSELASVVTKFPQTIVNVQVSRKPPWNELPDVQEVVTRQEGILGSQGRVLVRYSGTEPLARVMVEGKNTRKIRQAARSIADAIQIAIGAKTGRLT